MSNPILYVNGKRQSDAMDNEFIPDNKWGFKVVEVFTNGETRTYNNVTEIHWNHKNGDVGRAYESDIHSQGMYWSYDYGAGVKVVAAVATSEVTKQEHFMP